MKRSRWSFDDTADQGNVKDGGVMKSKGGTNDNVRKEDEKKRGVGRGTGDKSGNLNNNSNIDREVRVHPLVTGCRSVEHFEKISHIDEGTYGIVWKARERKEGKIVALKQVKFDQDASNKVGFPMAALREINVLLDLAHPNIVRVSEMVMGGSASKIFMVMEYMECDLKKAVGDLTEVMTQGECKGVFQQLCSAVSYMHSKSYFHRDLKTSNILVHKSGKVSICDFGLARKFNNPLRGDYTQMVITLWYRPPELLLGETTYGPEVDMWSLGCIFAELLTLKVTFEGQGELDQLDKIFQLLGAPSEESWPGFSNLPHAKTLSFRGKAKSKLREEIPSNSFSGKTYLNGTGFELLTKMLSCNPKSRITAKDAEKHEWFTEAPTGTAVSWNFPPAAGQ